MNKFFHEIKKFFTNIPVHEAIELAAMRVYDAETIPSMAKCTFVCLLQMQVTNTQLMACGK